MSTLVILLLLTLIVLSSSQTHDFQSKCQAGIRQDNTNYIYCGREKLHDIPDFTRITNTFYDELVLTDNQISTIPSNAFRGLRVKRLNLSGNKIRSISSTAFLELSNYLEELIIEFDSKTIRQIPDAIQQNLINLRSLKLIGLNLTYLSNHTFIQFRKLEHLSLVQSHLRSLEIDAFHSLSNLRYLNLDDNELDDRSWPSLTKSLAGLETLILSQNHFHRLQEERKQLPLLKHLDLSSNGLALIDTNIFHSLQKLSLQNNELNSLQLNFLYSLKHLKELNLDFNHLTFLPERIFQSNMQLTHLSLQGNDLTSLTDGSLFGLRNLLHLNLARNRLQFVFPQQPFQHLTSLKTLNLDRNPQMNLTENILQSFSTNLIELSLQNCRLTSMNYSLTFLSNLQRLKLSANFLQNLPKIFISRSVVSMDLQRNLLTSLPEFSDGNSSNLTDLDLSSNQIASIAQSTFLNFPKLKTIALAGNPLDCNCHLRWIKQWLLRTYEHDLIKFLQWSCAKPTNLANKLFTTISEQDMTCEEHEQSTTKTTLRTTSPSMSTTYRHIPTSTDDLLVNDVVVNLNGVVTISWKYRFARSFHVQMYDKSREQLLFQRLVDGEQRSMNIDLSHSLRKSPSMYTICINTERRRSCRNVVLHLRSDSITSASLILSSDRQEKEQYVYLLGGILLGAILVCSILLLICYCSRATPSIPTHESPPKMFYYHPLNIISYPQQTSNHTSECSLHSSTDISDDCYHLYQQISSVGNCQLTPAPI